MSKLQAVRDLLANSDNWMQQQYNNSYNDDPTCFCLIGAINEVWGASDTSHPFWADRKADVETLAKNIPEAERVAGGAELSVIDWNDDRNRTHEDILALLDLAIGESK